MVCAARLPNLYIWTDILTTFTCLVLCHWFFGDGSCAHGDLSLLSTIGCGDGWKLFVRWWWGGDGGTGRIHKLLISFHWRDGKPKTLSYSLIL
jgi:hypothetical protein